MVPTGDGSSLILTSLSVAGWQMGGEACGEVRMQFDGQELPELMHHIIGDASTRGGTTSNFSKQHLIRRTVLL